jgi:hypothetical protein
MTKPLAYAILVIEGSSERPVVSLYGPLPDRRTAILDRAEQYLLYLGGLPEKMEDPCAYARSHVLALESPSSESPDQPWRVLDGRDSQEELDACYAALRDSLH